MNIKDIKRALYMTPEEASQRAHFIEHLLHRVAVRDLMTDEQAESLTSTANILHALSNDTDAVLCAAMPSDGCKADPAPEPVPAKPPVYALLTVYDYEPSVVLFDDLASAIAAAERMALDCLDGEKRLNLSTASGWDDLDDLVTPSDISFFSIMVSAPDGDMAQWRPEPEPEFADLAGARLELWRGFRTGFVNARNGNSWTNKEVEAAFALAFPHVAARLRESGTLTT